MILPGEGPCLQPRGVKMHYEVELALIIGKMVRDLSADDGQGAMEAIRGMFLSPSYVRFPVCCGLLDSSSNCCISFTPLLMFFSS